MLQGRSNREGGEEGGSGLKFLEIGLYLFFFHKLDFSFSSLAAPFQTMLYIGLKDYQYFDPVDPLSSTLPKLCMVLRE